MQYGHNLNKFLEKNKDEMTFEDFKTKFYRNLRMFNQTYEEEQFDDLLLELYTKESDIYKNWYKILSKVDYSFLKSNTVLSTCLVSRECPDLITAAFDMEKKRKSILSRTVPTKATVSTVNQSKDKLLLEYKKLLLLIYSENEDNILRKAQEEFARCYSEYNDDLYLSDYYNSIIDNFEEELKKYINTQITKISRLEGLLTEDKHTEAVVTNIRTNQKAHKAKAFFKQTFK